MNNNLKSYLGNSKAFTLIELLVVVFIIGLLASVVLVGLGTFRARGRDARRIADLHSIGISLELFHVSNGKYPSAANWTDLKTVLMGAGIGVSAVPNDPLNDATYYYGVSANQQSYVMGAKLENVDHSVLRDDIDGGGSTNYGVDCADPIYCIKF